MQRPQRKRRSAISRNDAKAAAKKTPRNLVQRRKGPSEKAAPQSRAPMQRPQRKRRLAISRTEAKAATKKTPRNLAQRRKGRSEKDAPQSRAATLHSEL
jgi:hypothetical protein